MCNTMSYTPEINNAPRRININIIQIWRRIICIHNIVSATHQTTPTLSSTFKEKKIKYYYEKNVTFFIQCPSFLSIGCQALPCKSIKLITTFDIKI